MDLSSSEISTFGDNSQHSKIINPGNKINTVKLDEENFLLWKLQVVTVLRGHGLTKHIDEDADIPDKFLPSNETSSSAKLPNPAYELWVRQDSLITTWLLGSMSNSLLSEMLDCDTACEV